MVGTLKRYSWLLDVGKPSLRYELVLKILSLLSLICLIYEVQNGFPGNFIELTLMEEISNNVTDENNF